MVREEGARPQKDNGHVSKPIVQRCDILGGLIHDYERAAG